MNREQTKEVADQSWGKQHTIKAADFACCVCGLGTHVVVNIRFIAKPICNACCLAITKQTVQGLKVVGSGFEEKITE